MFYKHKKNPLLLLFIPLLIVWAALVIRVNTAFPKKTIVEYPIGEWAHYTPHLNFFTADLSICPVSCTVTSGSNISEQYPDSYQRTTLKKDKEYLIFEQLITNHSDTPVDIKHLVMCFFYCSPFNGNNNSLTYLDNAGVTVIPAGETVRIKCATIFRSFDLFPDSRRRFMDSDVYILFSQYPVERRLVYRIGE